MTGAALTVPDLRSGNVAVGWFEHDALPVIMSTEAWETLDEQEALLRAADSFIESLGHDSLEVAKALRAVEARRGQLLGVGVSQGDRTDLATSPRVEKFDVPSATATRYRTLARHLEDVVLPHLLAATSRREVSQANLLRLIRHNVAAPRPGAGDTCEASDLESLAGRNYGTVYADPPWLYGNQGTRAATGNHYGGMTVEEIAALPIAATTAEGAHCHLWTTNAFVFDAKDVLEAWGFTYKSMFVWCKSQMGIGNYWRVSHEIMLLGVKGALSFADHSQMSWREWPRGRHSAKPEQMYDIIESVSPGPYLELFARRARNGWTSWGNEVERDLFYEGAA